MMKHQLSHNEYLFEVAIASANPAIRGYLQYETGLQTIVAH
jgi:hypothetical protein